MKAWVPSNNSFERTTGLRSVAAQLMIRWAPRVLQVDCQGKPVM
jgi:hypothetical protein